MSKSRHAAEVAEQAPVSTHACDAPLLYSVKNCAAAMPKGAVRSQPAVVSAAKEFLKTHYWTCELACGEEHDDALRSSNTRGRPATHHVCGHWRPLTMEVDGCGKSIMKHFCEANPDVVKGVGERIRIASMQQALSAARFHVRSGPWDALRDEKGGRVQGSALGVPGGAHVLGIVLRHELCGARVELQIARSGRWPGVVSHVERDGDGANVAVVRFEDGDVRKIDTDTVQRGRQSDTPPLGMQEVRELCARVCMLCYARRGTYQTCCSAVLCEECRWTSRQNQRDAVGEVRSATPRAATCPFCKRAEGEVGGEPSSTQRSSAPTERRRAASQALKTDAGSAGPSLRREAARLSDAERGPRASSAGPSRRSKRVLSRRGGP